MTTHDDEAGKLARELAREMGSDSIRWFESNEERYTRVWTPILARHLREREEEHGRLQLAYERLRSANQEIHRDLDTARKELDAMREEVEILRMTQIPKGWTAAPTLKWDKQEADLRSALTERNAARKELDAAKGLLDFCHETLTLIVTKAPGYDWNADPLNLTLKSGRAFERITAFLAPTVPPVTRSWDFGKDEGTVTVPPSERHAFILPEGKGDTCAYWPPNRVPPGYCEKPAFDPIHALFPPISPALTATNQVSDSLQKSTGGEETPRLDFATLRTVNSLRCVEGFGHTLDSWSVAEWTNAMAGEAGEACNIAKKMLRHRDNVNGNNGEDRDLPKLREKLARELSDTVIYLDLVAASQGIDLGRAVAETFNAKSVELGVPHRLPVPPPTVPDNRGEETPICPHGFPYMAHSCGKCATEEGKPR